jgi:hypothetical protein
MRGMPGCVQSGGVAAWRRGAAGQPTTRTATRATSRQNPHTHLWAACCCWAAHRQTAHGTSASGLRQTRKTRACRPPGRLWRRPGSRQRGRGTSSLWCAWRVACGVWRVECGCHRRCVHASGCMVARVQARQKPHTRTTAGTQGAATRNQTPTTQPSAHTHSHSRAPYVFASCAIASGPSCGCVCVLLLLMATMATPLGWYSLASCAMAPVVIVCACVVCVYVCVCARA